MLIDLRNLLSGAKDDMTVSAPLEMETFRTALAEYPVMEKQPVELVLTRTGKDKLHISGNGFVALEIPCDRCLEPGIEPRCILILTKILICRKLPAR